jgi:hypothetical protein
MSLSLALQRPKNAGKDAAKALELKIKNLLNTLVTIQKGAQQFLQHFFVTN